MGETDCRLTVRHLSLLVSDPMDVVILFILENVPFWWLGCLLSIGLVLWFRFRDWESLRIFYFFSPSFSVLWWTFSVFQRMRISVVVCLEWNDSFIDWLTWIIPCDLCFETVLLWPHWLLSFEILFFFVLLCFLRRNHSADVAIWMHSLDRCHDYLVEPNIDETVIHDVNESFHFIPIFEFQSILTLNHALCSDLDIFPQMIIIYIFGTIHHLQIQPQSIKAVMQWTVMKVFTVYQYMTTHDAKCNLMARWIESRLMMNWMWEGVAVTILVVIWRCNQYSDWHKNGVNECGWNTLEMDVMWCDGKESHRIDDGMTADIDWSESLPFQEGCYLLSVYLSLWWHHHVLSYRVVSYRYCIGWWLVTRWFGFCRMFCLSPCVCIPGLRGHAVAHLIWFGLDSEFQFLHK